MAQKWRQKMAAWRPFPCLETMPPRKELSFQSRAAYTNNEILSHHVTQRRATQR
jgi:hypothetical protein